MDQAPFFELPVEDGEVLLWPPNPGSLNASVLSISSELLRKSVILREDGEAFTGKVRESIQGVVRKDFRGKLICMTGHQPGFLHPGIIIKEFLLEEMVRGEGLRRMRRAAQPLFLLVDTDHVGKLGIHYPKRDGEVISGEFLPLLDSPLPFELHAPPSRALWKSFLDQLRKIGEGFPSLLSPLERFCTISPPPEDSSSLAAFLERCKSSYLGTSIPYLTASSLSQTVPFAQFFLHLALEREAFSSAYNSALSRYREMRNLRSPNNPFPSLKREGGLQELPFWVLTSRGRKTLWVAGRSKTLPHTLDCIIRESQEAKEGRERAGEDAVILLSLSGDSQALIEGLTGSGLQIRPKAIPLMLFVRLFVSDLFIHGVGGGKYDWVTDRIAEEFLGLPPRPYLIASATISLARGSSGERERLFKLEQILRDLEFNPLRGIEHAGGSLSAEILARIRGLEEERKGILQRLQEAKGKEKGEVAKVLKRINEEMGEILIPVRGEVENQLEKLRQAQKSEEALAFREYPYFFFSPDDLRRRLTSFSAEGGRR